MAIMNWWAALTGRATPGAGNVRPTRNADAPATPDWTAMHAPQAPRLADVVADEKRIPHG